ncbi:MAG: carboxymuconolactone decarboxylase family protein [Acidimicrobiales bacterium]
MTVRDQFRSYRVVLPMFMKSDKRDLLRYLRRRPQLLAGTFAYETAMLTSGRVDARLKALAQLKAAALVNCEFCLDVGSSLAKLSGATDAQLVALPRYRQDDHFDDDEKLVLELAEAVTDTPALVSEDLRRRLEERLSPTELAELAAAIAWENNRGRLNQALGVRPEGFSDGAVCALAERPST